MNRDSLGPERDITKYRIMIIDTSSRYETVSEEEWVESPLTSLRSRTVQDKTRSNVDGPSPTLPTRCIRSLCPLNCNELLSVLCSSI